MWLFKVLLPKKNLPLSEQKKEDDPVADYTYTKHVLVRVKIEFLDNRPPETFTDLTKLQVVKTETKLIISYAETFEETTLVTSISIPLALIRSQRLVHKEIAVTEKLPLSVRMRMAANRNSPGVY